MKIDDCNRVDLGCYSSCEPEIDTGIVAFDTGEYHIQFIQVGINRGVFNSFCAAGETIVLPAVYFNENCKVLLDIYAPNKIPYEGMLKNGTLVDTHQFMFRTQQ